MNDLLQAPPERDLPSERRSKMRSALVRTVAIDQASTAIPNRVARLHPPRRKRGRTLGLVAAALVATLAFIAVPVILPSGNPASVNPATASLLHRFAALSLEAGPSPTLGPGQYLYEQKTSTTLNAIVSPSLGGSFRFFVTSVDERWLGMDGSGRSDWTMSQPDFMTEADRQLYETYASSGLLKQERGRPDWGTSGRHRYGPHELTFFDFSDLPTDVEELQGMIERREILGGPDGDWETFNLAADIMTWGYAPPEVRAALFEVMAELPGISASGLTHDAFARSGLVVGYTHDEFRQEIVLDRHTGAVLERRWVSVTGDPLPPRPEDVCEGPCGASQMWIAGPPGTLSSVTTYGVYGAVVDDVGDVPAGDERL